ncbi:MAG: Asp23/Gls24 family envelope stress response protein [Clostridiales bacterium]|nr:Asp23/Gls24 family envelope stress response protein [Clostridiales bacterium]
MAVRTNNIYGKIIISDKTIAKFVAHVAGDCYGVMDFVPTNVFNAVYSFLKFGSSAKGVKVRSSGDRIFIDINVIVKYGLSIKAVVESLREAVQYRVEKFTGMIVDTINVNVKGVTL